MEGPEQAGPLFAALTCTSTMPDLASLRVAQGAPSTGMALPDSFGVLLLSTIIVSAYVHFSLRCLRIESTLIGCCALIRLYGITVLQTLYYYERFPKDPWRLKTVVGLKIYVAHAQADKSCPP